MPEIIPVGQPGPANQKIGGVPSFHYFDFQSKGRGQVIRTMFEDAGIAYKDVRYSLTNGEYDEFKKGQLSQWNPQTTIPVVELNGAILTQSYAIIRHIARVLDGKYDGQTEDEKYWADVICDVTVDWRTTFLDSFLSEEKDVKYPKYCESKRPIFMKGMESQLKGSPLSQRGPYILGKDVCYADFVVYQILHDESLTKDGRAGLKDFPRLRELVDAMESRPAMVAFMKSDRYKG